MRAYSEQDGTRDEHDGVVAAVTGRFAGLSVLGQTIHWNTGWARRPVTGS